MRCSSSVFQVCSALPLSTLRVVLDAVEVFELGMLESYMDGHFRGELEGYGFGACCYGDDTFFSFLGASVAPGAVVCFAELLFEGLCCRCPPASPSMMSPSSSVEAEAVCVSSVERCVSRSEVCRCLCLCMAVIRCFWGLMHCML